MVKLIDRAGQRFGNAIVLDRAPNHGRSTWWSLLCDCGEEFETSAKTLSKNPALSCGCMRVSRRLTAEPGQMICEVPSKDYPDGRTGTYAGYIAHTKEQEIPCAECDSARTSRNKKRWREQSEEDIQAIREQNVIATKLYSERHPDRRRSTVELRKIRGKGLIRDAKDQPCADCRIQYPYYVMQFDHVRGEKKFNLGGGWNNSVESIKEEIEKCDVVCANCHAERTYQRMVSDSEVIVNE